MDTPEFAILGDVPNPEVVVKVDFQFNFAVDTEQNNIIAILTTIYRNEDTIFIKLVQVCTFAIDQNDWHKLEKDDNYVIPKAFAAHLMAITLSTARGVLFAKTQGTQWQLRFIGLQNLNQVFKEDVIAPKINRS